MLGTPARLLEIVDICRRHQIFLIEDTAWGCGGSLQGRSLGTWGDVGTYSFDFAKTMTTGEGGMLVFNDREVFQKAEAWHDHGHENNPTLPRWEDSRSSSGFNYRMMELQGAVGIAQLKKLPMIVSIQRENKALLWRAIFDLDGVEARVVPDDSYETADALVFLVKDNSTARRCRDALLKMGLSTKILPEAFSWHFAGTWEHMPELVNSHGGELSQAFLKSHEILSRAVSLPIGIQLADDVPKKVRSALMSALNS
jgi:8-amino-3,8-dideoxy-alpha-D-manno-octulosonate transaminase